MDVDGEKLIESTKPYMVLSGTWKLSLTNTPFSKNSYYWYSRGFQGTFLIFLCLLLLKLIQLILISANLQAIISNIAILLSSCAVLIKIFIYQKNHVPEMFQDIINEEKKVCQSLDDDLIQPYVKKTIFLRRLTLLIILNVLFAMGSLFIVSLVNFSLTDKSIPKSEKEMLEESFMYPFWLPYKEKDNMVSVIFINIVLAFVGIILYSVSHMIFATLAVFAITQFELLHIKISKLSWGDVEDDEYDGCRNLKAIVIEHTLLIE